MPNPRFSVITIGWNNRRGFLRTRDSVKIQTFSQFEWIIVDGASTDGTLEHLKRLNQPNFKWISEPHKGIFEALNKGLDRAAGEYIIFLNSGDRFAGKEVLARTDAVLTQQKGEWDLIFGDSYVESEDGKLLLKPALPAWAMSYGMITHHTSMFYHHKAIRGMRYNCDFRVAGDYDFTCRLVASGGRAVHVPFPVSIFEKGGNSERYAAIGRRENLSIQKRILGLGPIRRAGNYAMLLVSSLARSHMRIVYDRLRFREDDQSHEGGQLLGRI